MFGGDKTTPRSISAADKIVFLQNSSENAAITAKEGEKESERKERERKKEQERKEKGRKRRKKERKEEKRKKSKKE